MSRNMQGADIRDLGSAISTFKPGSKIELILGMSRPMSNDEVARVEQNLRDHGLPLLFIDTGSVPGEWSNALRLRFINPEMTAGYGFLPLIPVVPLIIGVVAVGGTLLFLGWKVGTLVQSISKNIIPIALITACTLGIIYVAKKKG